MDYEKSKLLVLLMDQYLSVCLHFIKYYHIYDHNILKPTKCIFELYHSCYPVQDYRNKDHTRAHLLTHAVLQRPVWKRNTETMPTLKHVSLFVEM